jgi:hypothetical protein
MEGSGSVKNIDGSGRPKNIGSGSGSTTLVMLKRKSYESEEGLLIFFYLVQK